MPVECRRRGLLTTVPPASLTAPGGAHSVGAGSDPGPGAVSRLSIHTVQPHHDVHYRLPLVPSHKRTIATARSHAPAPPIVIQQEATSLQPATVVHHADQHPVRKLARVAVSNTCHNSSRRSTHHTAARASLRLKGPASSSNQTHDHDTNLDTDMGAPSAVVSCTSVHALVLRAVARSCTMCCHVRSM